MTEGCVGNVSVLSRTEQAPIVLDLLYGLPYQSMEVFNKDLEDYMSTGAHGIDLYQLIVGVMHLCLILLRKEKSHHRPIRLIRRRPPGGCWIHG